MYNKFHISLRHCFTLAALLIVLCPNFVEKCLAEPVQAHQYVTVPFTDTQIDAFYRPHQLVIVGLQRDRLSPALPATFVFDTGSTHCAISASLAAKLGLPKHTTSGPADTILKYDGKPAIVITVGQLDIGAFQVKDVPINILPDEELKNGLGQPVDGILGGDIWHSLVVQLNFTKNELTFVARKNPVAYQELGPTPVSITQAEIEHLGFSKALIVPLLRGFNVYSALFDLKNGSKIESQDLLIDSGTPLTAISEPIADNLGLKLIIRTSYAAIENYDAGISWLPSASCGDLALVNLLIAFPARYSSDFIPRLGLDVLANYDILFDFPHLKMYLKPRTDLQAITSSQYEAASSAQRQQWAQKRLMIVYPTLDGYAIPYNLSADGLPIAQVRTDWTSPPTPFLLKTNTANVFITDALTKQWQLNTQTMLGPDGKLFLIKGQTVREARIPNFYFGGAQANGDAAVLPPVLFQIAASFQAVSGVIGSNFFFSHPVLMNPQTQNWLYIWKVLQPEDMRSLGMEDAAFVSVQDPDNDNSLDLPIEVEQGDAHFTDLETLATGSPFTLLSAQAAQVLKLTPEPQKLTYGAGKGITTFNQAHLLQLVIGGVVLKNVLVAYPIGAMPKDFYPRLGMNVISQLRLLVDAPAKKIYVKKAGN